MRPCLGILALSVLLAASVEAREKAPRAQDQVEFGVNMAQRGLWSEALFRFRQAERLGDNRASVLNNIAVAYEALGLFDQAETYYKKALDVDPRNVGLKRNYSRFVEFYQSFKPDQPGSPTGEDQPATAGDGNQREPLPSTPLDQPRTPEEPSGAPVNPS
jgi:tetratricopeptide (TPR) repeat protein